MMKRGGEDGEGSTACLEFRWLVEKGPTDRGIPPQHTPSVCSLNTVKNKGRFHSGPSCHSRKRAATVKLGDYSLHLREEKMLEILQINRVCSHKACMLL